MTLFSLVSMMATCALTNKCDKDDRQFIYQHQVYSLNVNGGCDTVLINIKGNHRCCDYVQWVTDATLEVFSASAAVILTQSVLK